MFFFYILLTLLKKKRFFKRHPKRSYGDLLFSVYSRDMVGGRLESRFCHTVFSLQLSLHGCCTVI